MTTANPNLPNDKEPVGTAAWRRFFRALAARAPVSGTVAFSGGTSADVTLNPAFADDQYNVLLEIPENERFWITAKTRSGFTVNADNPTSATLGFTIARR